MDGFWDTFHFNSTGWWMLVFVVVCVVVGVIFRESA